jgi:hypothetical protein
MPVALILLWLGSAPLVRGVSAPSASPPSVAPRCVGPYSRACSERSAARLAHQSGGLGVPSSNLGAPTTKITDFIGFSIGPRAAVVAQKPNEKRQNHRIGDQKSRTKSRTCSVRSGAVRRLAKQAPRCRHHETKCLTFARRSAPGAQCNHPRRLADELSSS